MTEPAKFTTTLQPWGNSLGLRIIRPLGEMAGLKKGAKVTIEVLEEGLLVKAAAPAKKHFKLPFSEADLVRGLMPSKAHADALPIPLPKELEP